MARRNEESQAILERGKLGKEFKESVFWEHLSAFLKDKIARGSELVVELTIAGEYEKAKSEGHRVSAFKEVLMYPDISIEEAQEIIDAERDKREYDKGIPSHVQ